MIMSIVSYSQYYPTPTTYYPTYYPKHTSFSSKNFGNSFYINLGYASKNMYTFDVMGITKKHFVWSCNFGLGFIKTDKTKYKDFEGNNYDPSLINDRTTRFPISIGLGGSIKNFYVMGIVGLGIDITGVSCPTECEGHYEPKLIVYTVGDKAYSYWYDSYSFGSSDMKIKGNVGVDIGYILKDKYQFAVSYTTLGGFGAKIGIRIHHSN